MRHLPSGRGRLWVKRQRFALRAGNAYDEPVAADILFFARRDGSFDPEAIANLVRAYDKAIVALHDDGQPAMVREIIAKKIIALAKKGDLNPDSLCARAIAAIGLPE